MKEMTPAEIRRNLGITQMKMAELCNTAVGTVRKWESGEQSPSGPAERLLDILYLLKEDELLDAYGEKLK